MRNKKSLIIFIISVIIVVGIAFGVYSYLKNDITFKLNSDPRISIEYGSQFIDPGFSVKNGLGEDLSSFVTVSGQVDSFTDGDYEIIYEFNKDNERKVLSRTVTVEKIEIDKLNIVLNGDETVYLLKGSEYQDKGAYVVNTFNNEKFNLGTIDISNNVDTKKVGKYDVNYVYKYNEQSISKTRKVEVFDITYSISPTTLTTGKVNISLNLDTISNYSNTKLPDGKTSLYKNIKYEVNESGKYTFVVTLTNNVKYEKTVTVDNIIANYKCSGTITNSGTKITVTPSTNNVKSYEWIINNKTVKGTRIYNKYKIVNKAKVNLVFENGQKYQVNCSVEDKLLYHFTYNLKDTGKWVKPEMQCNSYTASEKTKYDNMLKQAIKEAGGPGTRGGVVAAARFLIGALDYRVRYQGPRSTDSRVGRYAKVGLNIGNSNAWGCRVGGYIQGMDCTHFIEWVLYQNGIHTGPYSFPRSDTSKVIDKLKPGDLVYVPCGKSCANPSAGLSHVGMIIGIDGDIYYIAESVPGTDGKLGVTMHATKRSTVLKAYTLIGNIPFKSEGVVNNMWLTE